MSDEQKTSYTLLQRALDVGDEEAWALLVEHYKRFIYYVLHQLNVNADDIDDITQQVLVKLYQNLPSYDREKSRFRTWLSTVIRNAALSHFRQVKSRVTRVENYKEEAIFEGTSERGDVEAFIEKEWETYIASQAMEKVRKVFRGQTILAFELGLKGCSIEEISDQTNLTVASVYSVRKRVKKRLYSEIVKLIKDLEPS